MTAKPIYQVEGGEVFLAIHPEELRLWIRVWPQKDEEPYNQEIPCGESQFSYKGKNKYIKLPKYSMVVV